MRRLVEFRPEAESEIEAAHDWYELQRSGLGTQFLFEFDAVLSRASANARVFQKVGRVTRRALMRRFPYVVLFFVEDDRIVVTGVFHGRRDPGSWSDRVRERPVGWCAALQPIS